MNAITVEVQLACLGCRQPVACNAVLPQFTCDRCGRVASVPARVWKLALEEPVREAARLAPGREKVTAITTEVGEIQVVYRRAEPACLACRAPIDADAARASTTHYAHVCGCGMRAASRALAPEVGLAAVQSMLQEDPELLWPPERKEAVALRCSGCGGAATVSATTPRIFHCGYCSAQVYVPEDLWSLLHPVRAVKPFVLFVEAARGGAEEGDRAARSGKNAEPRAGGARALPREWHEVRDLVVGSDGTLYIALAFWSGRPTTLFAVDLDGAVRWEKEIPEKLARYTKLAWMGSGHVVVWSLDARPLLGVRASDGATEVELGASKSGDGVDRIDLRKVTSLACDPDGTILVGKQETNGTRLLRFSSAGAPLPLWAGMDADPPWPDEAWCLALEEAQDRAPGGQDVTVGVGWDGLTYLAGDQAVACFDRAGTRRYVIRDDESMIGSSDGRVGADARGLAITTADREVVRYPNRRRERWLHADDPRGLLREETHGAVAPDGSVWMAGSEGALRRFGPGRTLEWASVGARAADREAAEVD